MMLHSRIRSLLLVLVVVMTACKKPPAQPPPPPPSGQPAAAKEAQATNVSIAASADVNPDSSQRPSSVVVRIYQLSMDTAFNAAGFFDLFDNEQKTLDKELVGKSVEVTLRPGESTTVPNFFVDPYARFLGVIAAYRDIRNAQWKAVMPRPIPKDVKVTVGKLRIELAAK